MNTLHGMLNGRLPCSSLECELIQFAEQQAAEIERLREDLGLVEAGRDYINEEHGKALEWLKQAEQERDQLKADLSEARSCAKAWEQEMNRARADERTAMHYLEQIRKVVAPDVDFPTLVRMCSELQAQAVEQFKDELVKSVSVMYRPHIEGVCAVVQGQLRAKAKGVES